jgi:mannosyltransferase OCH1-like enzyme
MLHEMYYKFFSYVLEKLISQKLNKDTLRCLKAIYVKKKSLDYSAYFKPVKDLGPCIWTCWLQGYDNAPDIVKVCIDSIYKNASGGGRYDVIVITEENMSDYICIPDFIMDKYKRGIISMVHFSDLLRSLLLINYGGVWVDATVLLTKEIPQIILDSDFFVFRNSNRNSISPLSNWFIVARKGSLLLRRVFEVLAEYWKAHKYIINYYIFHICVKLIITHDEDAKQIWKNMFPKNSADSFILLEKLFDNMDVRMKDYLWDLSFAHKLTYKFYNFGDDSLLDKKDTFYQYIISENLNDTVN